jgi:hypothetical protein
MWSSTPKEIIEMSYTIIHYRIGKPPPNNLSRTT